MPTNDVIAQPPPLPVIGADDLGPYAGMNIDASQLAELFAVNVGAAGITIMKIPRIRMPQAGGESFTVPDPVKEGGTQQKTFQGVILDIRDIRAYWKTAYGEESSSPPSCFSNDCVTGVGDPGGKCEVCPLAAFGSNEMPSGKKGRGQACKHFKQLFVARPYSENILPEFLNAPPTALSKFENYSLHLLGKQNLLNGVLTEFGLVREKGSSGTYSRLSFRAVAKLSPEVKVRFAEYAKQMSPLWTQPQGGRRSLVDVQQARIEAPADARIEAQVEGEPF